MLLFILASYLTLIVDLTPPTMLTFSIDLPSTVSKSMLSRDLDFYGINAANGTIEDTSVNRKADTLRLQLNLSQSKHDMFLLAMEAHYQYNMKKSVTSSSVKVSISSSHRLYQQESVSAEEKALFENYLDNYFGLKLHNESPPRRSSYFYVCAKEE